MSCRLHKMITVLVGHEEDSFTVDKSFLLTSSEFFKKTLETSPKTNGPEEVDLPDVEPRAFQIYLGWLETGYFYITEEDDLVNNSIEDDPGTIDDDECRKWNECYTLGHAIRDCSFQDACIDWILEKMVFEDMIMLHVPLAVYAICDKIPAHRQFAVDGVAHLWDDDDFENLEDEKWPSKFILDLAKYMGSNMRHKNVADEDYEKLFENIGCKYHAHVALNKPCYKKTHPAYR
ncbi:uncharacterized protein J4E84_007199 [Alternaria hordeiaustralica]|uniref:uncharacterized protein n=1 Tax=Alternaria hordeiaustralica TaxID=1187925 RepID=UPI0020C4584B|nr:uncharacterized protein J4E84_007199 [Alternaria hordeiaustralica]KAI4682735.1 hypothetical protein J4E84_007199 [Alternaria hordeiaustralica]